LGFEPPTRGFSILCSTITIEDVHYWSKAAILDSWWTGIKTGFTKKNVPAGTFFRKELGVAEVGSSDKIWQ
jgi:hypothetical protein|tara:strand:+ start:466 stop:678 length:213 start_codon:yes stop_codon:yes gene_type:complete